MANYLVTGAAGFIGAAIAKRLVSEGNSVTTIDNLSTGCVDNIPSGVKFINGDCGIADTYNKLSDEKFNAILHVAGQSSGEVSFDDPVYDIRTNAESTLLLLKYALENKCKRFIYASTMSVYGVKPDNHPVTENEKCTPESFYGVAKLASEHYLRIYEKFDVKSTSLRLFNVYGPGQNLTNLRQGMVSIFLAQMLKENKIHVKGSKERFRDFVYIDDVVDAFVRCISNKKTYGKRINIGTGVSTTVENLLEKLLTSANQNSAIDYHGSTEGDIHGICADIQQMKNLLGFDEMTKLEDGLSKMVAWAESAER